MKKRAISIILCLSLFMSLGTLGSATGLESSGNEADLIPQSVDLEWDRNNPPLLPSTENISEFRKIGSEILEDEDLFISEEVAFYIAQFFVSDMIATQTTKWNDETHIAKTICMTKLAII